MHTRTWLALSAALALGVALAGCERPVDPGVPSLSSHGGVTGSATGGGHLDLGVDVEFSVGVVQFNGFDATGQFRFSTALGGEAIEFHGRATCMTVDPVNNRAWIGGVVTQNNSTHPAFTTAIHDVGRDIWFRAVDYGEGSGALQADRSTFVGFEGAAGIITSVEYCEARIWPGPPTDPVDARTGPVTAGNVQVRAGG